MDDNIQPCENSDELKIDIKLYVKENMTTTYWEYYEFFKSEGNSEIMSLYKAYLARCGEKVSIGSKSIRPAGEPITLPLVK